MLHEALIYCYSINYVYVDAINLPLLPQEILLNLVELVFTLRISPK